MKPLNEYVLAIVLLISASLFFYVGNNVGYKSGFKKGLTLGIEVTFDTVQVILNKANEETECMTHAFKMIAEQNDTLIYALYPNVLIEQYCK